MNGTVKVEKNNARGTRHPADVWRLDIPMEPMSSVQECESPNEIKEDEAGFLGSIVTILEIG